VASAIIDTNVILRHVLRDVPSQSAAATALLRSVEAGGIQGSLSAIAVAEAVWVLAGRVYAVEREDIREALTGILQIANLAVPERQRLLRALDLFAQSRLDFADAYHSALALEQRRSVYSFDRDFDRVPGITRIEPPLPKT
jgi:predicted nucleic acid-binding protein